MIPSRFTLSFAATVLAIPGLVSAQQAMTNAPAKKPIMVGELAGTVDRSAGILSGINMSSYNANGTLGAAYGQLIESFKGGSSSDSDAPVVGAVRGYNQIGSEVTNWVGVGGLFTADNLAWKAQAVGMSAQGNSWRGGRVWGATLEGIERPDIFCSPEASMPMCVAIPGDAKKLTVANGFIETTETVIINNVQLAAGVDYVDEECSGSTQRTCKVISLSKEIGIDSIAYVYRGDPLQGIVGVEVDATGGPGVDAQNTLTGNRIGVAVVGVQTQTSKFSGTTHIGSMVSLSTNSNVIADRGMSFSGFDGIYRGKNGLDFNNTLFTGNAIYIPGSLERHQNIGIGDTSTAYSVNIAGDKLTMPNGVGMEFRDNTSTPIDMRAFASGTFGTANIGTWSDNDLVLWRNSLAAIRLSSTAFIPGDGTRLDLGSPRARWASFYANKYFSGSESTPGVSCRGTPSPSFSSINGIITHC